MGTIQEESKTFEPLKTMNIADLKKVPINMELYDDQGTGSDGEIFKFKFIEVDGKHYRVPLTVLGQVKALLEKVPQLELIQVIKSGEGLSTRYTVIPYQEPVNQPVQAGNQ